MLCLPGYLSIHVTSRHEILNLITARVVSVRAICLRLTSPTSSRLLHSSQLVSIYTTSKSCYLYQERTTRLLAKQRFLKYVVCLLKFYWELFILLLVSVHLWTYLRFTMFSVRVKVALLRVSVHSCICCGSHARRKKWKGQKKKTVHVKSTCRYCEGFRL